MKKYKKWSKEDLCYISENCQKMKDRELAILLSKRGDCEITVDMLRRQRRNLKIRKSRGRPCRDQEEAETDVSENEKFCSMQIKREN